jgi:hypothetical protein
VGQTKSIYDEYPLLKRVEPILSSVQNSENSTGRAQYRILQTPQGTGKTARFGKFMNVFKWSTLRNDERLSAAQRKTVNKILISLQVPARDKFRNRPAITFNPNGMTVAQINQKVRATMVTRPVVQNSPNAQSQRPVMRRNPTFVENSGANLRAARQHRQAFGN